MKKIARECIYGILGALSSFSIDSFPRILMYHSVGGNGPLSVDIREFTWQMEYLSRFFTVVPLASLPALFQGGESKPFAAITFDDGLRDGYDSALPILENMGLPATFFITTKYIGGLHPVFYGSEECMSERHIAALSRRGFFLGAHTVTHPMLGNLSNSDAQWEISESKRIIEEIIGERVMSFAYPKGHYTDSTKRIVASLGFTNAVTVREGSCVVNEDPFALPRIAIDRGTGRLQFKGKLSRALYPYERVKKLYVGR